MTVWTCATCGIEHPDTQYPPPVCEICSDDRQWVPLDGQHWTSQAELASTGHHSRVELLEPDLYGLTCTPSVGIGQRGLIVRTSGGNLLWEPPGFIDALAVDLVHNIGGIAAIAASHPHLTGASIQWSHAFDGAPVWVASADRAWIRRPDPAIELWQGALRVLPGLTLIQCGGHFAGSSFAHWPAGAHEKGVLITGDTIAIGGDHRSVNSMRSFVNNIPLPERAIRRILAATEPLEYDRIYSAFTQIDEGAKQIVDFSLNRYIDWIRGDVPDEPDS